MSGTVTNIDDWPDSDSDAEDEYEMDVDGKNRSICATNIWSSLKQNFVVNK